MSRSLNLALALTLAAPVAAQARAQALGQGFELERAGRYADAANVYLTTLRADPANLPALLGLERVLPPLSRLAELLPLVQRARAQAPQSGALRGFELRVYAGLNEPDSLAAAARRWADAAPGSDAPYREWAAALASRRGFDDARRVLLLGRRTLRGSGGGEATLAMELAELEQRVGKWEGAAREWGRAVTLGSDALPNASSHLSAAPAAERERIIRVLTAPGVAARTRWLGAELLLAWGRPLEGWALFEQTLVAPLPEGSTETAGALRRYADLAGALATPDGHRVRGLALSRWADLVPPPLAQRARAEAVRALLEGGDRAAARLALERLAGDTLAAPNAQAVAEAALLDVLIADGQLDVAERRLAAGDRVLGGEDRGALRLALARARIARGELDRAAAALGDDSSVAAIAQRGWIALYRGELRGASDAFRAAGPYAGDRAAATERTAILALLQQIPDDTLPELGAALLTLARGDSSASVAALRRVAGRLTEDDGRPDVLLLAGQIAARLDAAHQTMAAGLFEEIMRGGGEGGGSGIRAPRGGPRVGTPPPPPGPRPGRRPATRAPDLDVPGQRVRPRSAARAGAGAGSDSEIMRRRDFVQRLSGYAAMGLSADAARLLAPFGSSPLASPSPLASLLVPMDDAQSDHLKAYGLTYRVIQAGLKAEWLLNHRGGAFLLPDSDAIRRDAALSGVRAEPADGSRVTAIRGEIAASNMDAVPLEKAPKVAVYVPPNAAPWDDAVTMALQYAGIPFAKVWDPEVAIGGLRDYDWLHLHHEDFTGQYSKFFLIYAGAPWLAEMVQRNGDTARRLGFQTVPAVKKAVARGIRDYVANGGFLFAMCTATETIDLALAAEGVDIAAAFADGTPIDPRADGKLDWARTFAFSGARVEPNPLVASFSDIDGHQVNAGPRRQPLGAFKLFNFSAKIDPVPAMLVQNHRQVIPDFYGLTTSFLRARLKPGVTVLAEEEGAPWVKYVHGDLGKGTWTFFGGHDPEDPQHQIGDPPTDLSLHPHSPGYRLILNNVLFPAAKKRELKT